MLASTIVSYSGALGDLGDLKGEERELRVVLGKFLPAGQRCVTLDLLLAQCLFAQRRGLDAAEILKDIYGKPEHELRHMDARGFNGVGLSPMDRQTYSKIFVKVASNLWQEAHDTEEKADVIYRANGGRNTTESIKLYLKSLWFLYKSQTWLGDKDQATMQVFQRCIMKTSRQVNWSDRPGSDPREKAFMFTPTGAGGDGGARLMTGIIDLEPQWTMLVCAECFSDAPKQVCGGCQCARYCNRACQTLHWKRGHKSMCEELKAVRESAEADNES